MMDIFEVGTGGGSIARVETGNALRVGPQSAGSIPGPVCYGRGGNEPTVTDANLLLGRLDADHFLGGEIKLDLDGCRSRCASASAKPLGLDPTEAADGILRIAVTQMSHAVKAVTTERGLDAGSFTMVVYGGAGPLHASAIAREIGIRKVLIPYAPGYFSAYGMLFSDLRYDYVRSVFRKLDDVSFDEIEAFYESMEDEGRAALAQSGIDAGRDRHRARRRHALRRPGACGHGRPAAGLLRKQGPLGHQAAVRRAAQGALRHLGAEGAGRPGEPARDGARAR